MVALFTHDELNSFTVVQLKKLANYYGISYGSQIKKPELVEKIYNLFSEPQEEEENLPKMSVRLKRIYDSLHKLP